MEVLEVLVVGPSADRASPVAERMLCLESGFAVTWPIQAQPTQAVPTQQVISGKLFET